jgi:hypothetical protein
VTGSDFYLAITTGVKKQITGGTVNATGYLNGNAVLPLTFMLSDLFFLPLEVGSLQASLTIPFHNIPSFLVPPGLYTLR